MQLRQSWTKWGFLFQWTTMNLLGTVIGVAFLVLMYALLLSDASKGVTALFDQGISVAIMGLFLGLFQWLVLKTRMEQIRSWIPATSIGLVLGATGIAVIRYLLIGDSLGSMSPPLGAAVIGALLGTAQWTVLRKHLSPALPWILGSTAGWSLGSTALVALGLKSFSATNVFQEFLLGALVMIIAIGIYSTITGWIFIWLAKPK